MCNLLQDHLEGMNGRIPCLIPCLFRPHAQGCGQHAESVRFLYTTYYAHLWLNIWFDFRLCLASLRKISALAREIMQADVLPCILVVKWNNVTQNIWINYCICLSVLLYCRWHIPFRDIAFYIPPSCTKFDLLVGVSNPYDSLYTWFLRFGESHQVVFYKFSGLCIKRRCRF